MLTAQNPVQNAYDDSCLCHKSEQRTNNRFLVKLKTHLQEEIKFPKVVLRCIPGPSFTSEVQSCKDFEDASVVVQRRTI